MKKIAIIGGGLSGLYTAAALEKHADVTLFEARERLGGRICTIDGFDLGPSWVWPHQSRILSLIRFLGLEIIHQYEEGSALYETPHTIERFKPPSGAPSGRIKGGVGAVVEAMASKLSNTDMHLNEPVISMTEEGDRVLLISSKQNYSFDEIIITLPPRLILETLRFEPPLAPEILESFQALPTWMGHCAKCVIEFETPFWRDSGLSGFCFSHSGPMGEIHDACIEGRYALFGFINANVDRVTMEEKIREQCRRLFGTYAERIVNLYCVDWKNERFTAVSSDAKAPAAHPNYGVQAAHANGKIHFIGTETSFEEGGYLEGSIASAEKLCKNFIP